MSPRKSQESHCTQVDRGKKLICAMQATMPARGVQGTKGTLNPRLYSGCVMRKIHTPRQTIVKINSVMIDTSSPKTLMGNSPAANMDSEIVIAQAKRGVFVHR